MTHRANHFNDIFENDVEVRGNLTAKKLFGDGSGLTNLPTSSETDPVWDSEKADYARLDGTNMPFTNTVVADIAADAYAFDFSTDWYYVGKMAGRHSSGDAWFVIENVDEYYGTGLWGIRGRYPEEYMEFVSDTSTGKIQLTAPSVVQTTNSLFTGLNSQFQATLSDEANNRVAYLHDNYFNGYNRYVTLLDGYGSVFYAYDDYTGQTVNILNGTYAIDASGNINCSSTISANTITASYYGTFGYTHTAIFGDDGIKAGECSDGTNTFTMCNGTYSFSGDGDGYVDGDLDITGAFTASNISGTNTGDQDLSSYALTSAVSASYALKSNVLELNNTTAFTPDADYEPATKKYVDDNAGGDDYKELWFYPHDASVSASALGNWVLHSLTGSGVCNWVFRFPFDFASISSAAIVIIPDTTETIDYDVDYSLAAPGEDYDNYSGAAVSQTLAVTIKDITEIDIKSILEGGSPAANDYCGLKFSSNTSNIRVIGLRIKYVPT